MSKIINLENLKPIVNKIKEQNTLIGKLQNENKVLKLDVESLNYLINGDCSEDKFLNGIAKSVVIPSGTAPKGEILSLAPYVRTEQDLTARAGVVGETIKSENLIILDDVSPTTISGITYSVKNGVITMNGTTTTMATNIDIPLVQRISFTKNVGVFSITPLRSATIGGMGIYLVKEDRNLLKWSDGTSGFQAGKQNVNAAESATTTHIRVAFNNTGIECNNLTLKPMLVEGDVAPTEFKQGFEGLSSPKFTEMELCGENLFDTHKLSNVSDTFSFQNDGSIKVLANKSGGFSWVFVTPMLIKKGTYYLYTDFGNTTFMLGGIWASDNGRKLELTEDYLATSIWVNANASFTQGQVFRIWLMKEQNKTFKPYQSQTLTLPEQTLNGQDEIYSYVEGNELVVKKITRYGSVDLGTLTYTYITDGTYPIFLSSAISDILVSADQTKKPNIICSKYSLVNITGGSAFKELSTDKIFTLRANQKDIMFRDNSYTNATDFKNSLNGVMLVYELAQPTITEIARVPLTCDFKQIENVITNNVEFATETQNIQKGVVVASMTEKVETRNSNDELIGTYLETKLAQIKERVENITLGYIDFDRKVFVKNKGRDNLGSITNWQYETTTTGNWRFHAIFPNAKPAESTTSIPNILCDYYEAITPTETWSYTKKGITMQSSNTWLIIADKDLTSVEMFKQFVSGLYFTYELAIPQEIDISDILDDSDNAIRLEENGSVEFSDTTEYNIHYARKVN